ncbi:hypothetical protein SynPROS91_00863 [Synechococcus sp. PROS-9-1]|nr:hypothetical protein SynPROS91_00863 [Synechococcus sp. PROS-9-1]
MGKSEFGSSSGQLHHLEPFRKKASNGRYSNCLATHRHSTLPCEQETE